MLSGVFVYVHNLYKYIQPLPPRPPRCMQTSAFRKHSGRRLASFQTDSTSSYGVATIRRLLKIMGLFCRIESLS